MSSSFSHERRCEDDPLVRRAHHRPLLLQLRHDEAPPRHPATTRAGGARAQLLRLDAQHGERREQDLLLGRELFFWDVDVMSEVHK